MNPVNLRITIPTDPPEDVEPILMEEDDSPSDGEGSVKEKTYSDARKELTGWMDLPDIPEDSE